MPIMTGETTIEYKPPVNEQAVRPLWFRATHLVGLLARSQLMLLDLQQANTVAVRPHLLRMMEQTREAGLDSLYLQAERLANMLATDQEERLGSAAKAACGTEAVAIPPAIVHELEQLQGAIADYVVLARAPEFTIN